MKIIFLDVDGVLNTVKSTFGNLSQEIWDNTTCNLLINICKYNPDVKIVVSSTWRLCGKNNCLLHFQRNGFKLDFFHFDWTTPNISVCKRGDEIQQWLGGHDNIDNYVILDDDFDMLETQLNNFIKINAYNGITYDQYLDLCKVLDVENNYLNKKYENEVTHV